MGGTRRRVPSAIPRTSAGNHSSTRPQLGRRHRFGLLSSPRGAAVMNGNEMLPVFMNISYQQCRNASSFCAIVIPPPTPNFSSTKDIFKLPQSHFFPVGISFLLLIVAGYWSTFFHFSPQSPESHYLLLSRLPLSLSPFLFLSFFFTSLYSLMPCCQNDNYQQWEAFFSNLFHSMMNIQRRQQFSCMAVKSHVCLLKGMVHLICELTE